jgi:hypothetical protein
MARSASTRPQLLDRLIEPMTLGNMRANGVRSLDVSCCRRRRAAKSSRRVRPDWRAMAMSPRKGGLDPDQLSALRMIAESHFGCTQSVLLAHGLKHEILTELIDKGPAKATPGTVRIGPSQQAIKVTWLTITAEGPRRSPAGSTKTGRWPRSPSVSGLSNQLPAAARWSHAQRGLDRSEPTPSHHQAHLVDGPAPGHAEG